MSESRVSHVSSVHRLEFIESKLRVDSSVECLMGLVSFIVCQVCDECAECASGVSSARFGHSKSRTRHTRSVILERHERHQSHETVRLGCVECPNLECLVSIDWSLLRLICV